MMMKSSATVATWSQPRPFLLPKKRVLILGTGRLATDVCRAIASEKAWHFTVVGLLARKPDQVGDRLANSAVIGSYAQLADIIDENEIDTVVVCLEDRRSMLPLQPLLDLKTRGIEIIDGHAMFEQVAGRLSIDMLNPSNLIFSTGFRRRASAVFIKRVLDLVLSICGIAALAPVGFLVAICIKLDSKGPVFYRQIRVGLRGEPYLIWKFRSMKQDAERDGARWAQASDPRITRVGWWLRKTRIDEFPQLINVLRGEMSLVGPRPERPVFVQDLRDRIPYYEVRHTVRPGITGWAQVKFRYGASREDAHTKLQYDLYYVKNLSLWLDFKILVRTVQVMVLGEGAH
jgi:sugar transferase (PEP-CTERM system associated)